MRCIARWVKTPTRSSVWTSIWRCRRGMGLLGGPSSGASDTLTVTLKPGRYEVYCPVGQDSHKKLGMDVHLEVQAGNGSAGRSELGRQRHPDGDTQAGAV